MFGMGFLMTLIGLLAEAPEFFAKTQQLPPGTAGEWLPAWVAGLSPYWMIFDGELAPQWPLAPDDLTRLCLAWIGLLLCLCGLYRMAVAKWRHWGLSLLVLLGLPGAFLGLAIALALRSRNPRWGRKKQSRARRTLGRAKPFRRSA